MRSVTHRQMRNSSGEILRAVAAGESVQVTNNGQIAAVISPPGGDQLELLVARGEARPPRHPIAVATRLRRRRPSRATSELLADSRGHW